MSTENVTRHLKHSTLDLSRLHDELRRCKNDVNTLHSLAEQEPDVDDVLAVSREVSSQLHQIQMRYTRVLRKQVSLECEKLEYLLEELRMCETQLEWKRRHHRELANAVQTYRRVHTKIPPP